MDLIVDAGSILTPDHGDSLAKIGVKPKREKEFRTIEERKVKRSTGAVVLSLDEGDVEVVFAEEGDEEVIRRDRPRRFRLRG